MAEAHITGISCNPFMASAASPCNAGMIVHLAEVRQGHVDICSYEPTLTCLKPFWQLWDF